MHIHRKKLTVALSNDGVARPKWLVIKADRGMTGHWAPVGGYQRPRGASRRQPSGPAAGKVAQIVIGIDTEHRCRQLNVINESRKM